MAILSGYKSKLVQIVKDYKGGRCTKAQALRRIAQVADEAYSATREEIEREARKAIGAL